MNVRPLTEKMRAAVVDRNWVTYSQAKCLADRGLASYTSWPSMNRYQVHLTNAGEAIREEILAPLVPGARVRNTISGLLGRVVRIDRSKYRDIVVLLWDDWKNEACGSAAYLEIVDDDPMAAEEHGHWLEITAAGAARLASHLRVGLDLSNDAALRGFLEAFVQDLER